MSKKIDITKPLSDDDRAWLEQWGRTDLIARADAEGAEASAATAGPSLPSNLSREELLTEVPNTGDVNTGGAKQVGAGTVSERDQEVKELASRLNSGEYTVEQLRDAAEERGLSKDGRKAELAQRLAEHVVDERRASADDDEDSDNKDQ